MNTVLVATIAGLVTAIAWGTSDWLSAHSTKQLSPIQINFVIQSMSILFVSVLFLCFGFHAPNTEQYVRIIGSSLIITTAYLIFIKALSVGTVGIVVPLSSVYPLITVGLSVIFLKTGFRPTQLLAMIGIVLGAALLAYEKDSKQLPFHQRNRATILALFAAVVWGIGFFITNPVLKNVPWQSILMISEPTAFLFALICLCATNPKDIRTAMSAAFKVKITVISGFIGVFGTLTLYFGSGYSHNILIPLVMSAGGPLVSSLWGAVIEHEKIGILKRVGAVVIVGGIIVINIA